MATQDDPLFVTALARGLSVLRCFSRSTPVLGTTEIARMVQLPQPTVWRLCQTLVKLGYLRFTADNRLRLGIGCLSLGYELLAQHGVAELARPYMKNLAQRFQGAVSLGSPDGDAVVYLQRCSAGSIIMANLGVGSRVPLVSSAIGWAYLADLDNDGRANAIAALDPRAQDAFIRLEPAFNHAQSAYAACGYIEAKGVLHADINAVAVSVRTGARGDSYMLSCGGVASTFTPAVLKEAGAALVDLAANIKPALPV